MVTRAKRWSFRIRTVLVVVCALAASTLAATSGAGAAGPTCNGEAATIVGTSGPDVLRGTPGRDVIVGLGGADVINGRGGADLICAGYGADVVRGGLGPDIVYAGPGNDRVFGGDGFDLLFGGAGADYLQGNRHADRVVGGPGPDQVMGGVGNDVVEGGLGNDRATGGGGIDDVDGGAGLDRCSADDRIDRCEQATPETEALFPTREAPIRVDRVVHVSIDGLRSDHVTSELMPVLTELRSRGVSTLNARNDPALTNTLPNHTAQITGRPIEGPSGHGIVYNEDLGRTVHDEAGEYVASVYDVVHDNGFTTGAYIGKSKFTVHDRSWNAVNGAPDVTGVDNGRDKIDIYLKDPPDRTVAAFIDDLDEHPNLAYAFVHIRLPDSAGHSDGWGSSEYVDSVSESDLLLGLIVDAVDSSQNLRDSTAVIVTSDHGGPLGETSHFDHENPANFRIPFVVWAPGVRAGGDLYDLNPQARRNPGPDQVGLTGRQPVRGHEAGNLALDLLGLSPIPGSVFNADFDLELR